MEEGKSTEMEEMSRPVSGDEYEEIVETITNLRDLPYEHLVVEFEDIIDDVLFIQTAKNGDNYLVEIAKSSGGEYPYIFRKMDIGLADALEIFKEVCAEGNTPNLSAWEDVTEKVIEKESVYMNIFKRAYKVVRENSNEIYKGFGFKHLSDATQYYVHPDNQSYKGKTTLCQPIGESVILFTSLLAGMNNGNEIGDCYVSEDKNQVYLDLFVPKDYRDNGVVSKEIYRYRALSEGNIITISAYGKDQRWLEGDMNHLRPLYKLLPAFCVLLAREMESDSNFKDMMESFQENPTVDSFVNIHEDFYQMHKADEYEVIYKDLPAFDTEEWSSFSSKYTIIRENMEEMMKEKKAEIITFDPSVFNEEQISLIPRLSEEFVLQDNLRSLCSAVTAGDIRSVLFHGPAGTGKTISCKLISQTIGLPIMETINCTENLDEFVLGKYIPEGDKIYFKESYVTKAIRDGGAVVFEEINFAKPQYLAFLNSLLDDNGFVRLDNGEVVKRNPNFRFFATMNMGYYGTKDLNQALFNRFNAIIEVAALSDESIVLMLKTRIPECEPVVDKILGVYHKLKKKIEAEELDVVLSPRNLENWARMAKYDGYIAAAEKTLIPIAKADRVLENTIRGILMLYKWK